MTLQKYLMTSFQKKTILDSILTKEFIDCKHRVIIRHEWKRPDQIFTIFALKNNTIEFGVNLNTDKHKYFDKLIDGTELQMIYRAYFVSSYIRCLDNVTATIPQTYFSGLVLLCAINALCSGKSVNVFSPIERKLHDLKPIDIYCSIRALTKIANEHVDKLTKKSNDDFKNLISELLTYSTLPEIGYKGDNSIYSLLKEIKELNENTMSHRCEMSDYALFDKLGTGSVKNLSISDMAAICEESQDAFWGNVVIRLSIHLAERLDLEKNHESFITHCIHNFEQDSVKYYLNTRKTENALLIDNIKAIKNLSLKSKYVFSAITANSGRIHFFR